MKSKESSQKAQESKALQKIKAGHFFTTHPNNYKDWVVGSFIKEEEFCADNFELKFQRGEQGLLRKPKKALNENVHTLAIAVYGYIRMNFAEGDIFMRQEGDYIYWNPDAPHEFEFLEDSLVITLRWKA
jgi:hypothetical protein